MDAETRATGSSVMREMTGPEKNAELGRLNAALAEAERERDEARETIKRLNRDRQ